MSNGLSRHELSQVVDYAHRCLAADGLAQIESLITGLDDLVPFQKAAACAFTLRPEPESVSLEHFVNHSFGAKWAALYTQEKLQRVDPVLRYSRAKQGAFKWRDALINVNGAGATFMEAAKDFGLVDGASHSGVSATCDSLRTVFSMTVRNAADADRAQRFLSVLGPHLHESYKNVLFFSRKPDDRARLSPREKEVLSWSQQGKTYWEIGCILGISERTVKYHFAKVKMKLNVVSIPHAVAKAMRMGLIY